MKSSHVRVAVGAGHEILAPSVTRTMANGETRLYPLVMMNSSRMTPRALIAAVALAIAIPITHGNAQSASKLSGTTLEASVAPGNNFDKANFRLWYPNDVKTFDGIALLVPGSNGDGRDMARDSVWQAFAVKHRLALVACQFTDKKHDQGFIEEYVNVSQGSGQALLHAINEFAERSKHPELANAPMLLWGMSAGGQFNYEFVAWKPERVIAFVVNKGGIYYTALAPRAARNVPGLLFTGGKDLEFRTNTINGLFAVNRRGGALWALAEEPGVAHVVGRSRDVAMVFFADVLKLRLDAAAPTSLRALTEKSGFIGDLKAKTFAPIGDTPVPNYPTAWLPTQRSAEAWQAMVTEKPFPFN
jgi:poly(3-hydroxybutyrate) depolymerase